LTQDKFDRGTDSLQTNVIGVFVYDKTEPIRKKIPCIASINLVHKFTLVPSNKMPVRDGKPDISITSDLDSELIDDMNKYVNCCQSLLDDDF
jgi:hypothetical protein